MGIVDRHSLEWTYEFNGGMTFRSLTGFVHNENLYFEDTDGSFANAVTCTRKTSVPTTTTTARNST